MRILITLFSMLLFAVPSFTQMESEITSIATAAYDRGDYTTAMRLWRPLADQGNPQAQYRLGFMYHVGQGVPQDYAEAMYWLRKAADQGIALAQFGLATMYHEGRGVPRDLAEAARWYRKAAELGVAMAQSELGFMYHYGEGAPQDYAEAARLYRKAAEQGDAKAQCNLGLLYYFGNGLPRNYMEAHIWLNLGTSRASGELQSLCARGRDLVTKKIPSRQLAEAQRRAREWKPKGAEDK